MANINDFKDYMKSFERAKERYGWSHATFNDTLSYYNLSRLPDYENGPEPYISYILMSRPMINIHPSSNMYDAHAFSNFSAIANNSMTSAFANDIYGAKMLMALSAYSANPWLPIITTKAKSYQVNDVELKTVDKGNTYYGHVLKYGKHSEDHKISGTISIDFRNDRYLSILKLMYLWSCCIYMESKNGCIVPTEYNQNNAILDYPASLYYLVTRRDGRELVYWEKLTGVFPIKVPFSVFTNNSDGMIIEDTISIDFSYGIRSDPCDPDVLLDINVLSGDAISTIKNKTIVRTSRSTTKLTTSELPMRTEVSPKYMNEAPFVKGDILATNPYIRLRKKNGHLKYYLCWESR